MSGRLYDVVVAPRFPDEGGREVRFTVNADHPQARDVYGATAREIAHSVAGDYCDSGSVTVRARRGGDRFTVGRR